jgi:hypothetical protein
MWIGLLVLDCVLRVYGFFTGCIDRANGVNTVKNVPCQYIHTTLTSLMFYKSEDKLTDHILYVTTSKENK